MSLQLTINNLGLTIDDEKIITTDTNVTFSI